MSAAIKIPDALVPEVLARIEAGWSLRRTADWLRLEKNVDVTRNAVAGCLGPAMVSRRPSGRRPRAGRADLREPG